MKKHYIQPKVFVWPLKKYKGELPDLQTDYFWTLPLDGGAGLV